MSKGSFATTVMLGRLGKDPEKFDTQGGKMIVTLNLATTSGYGNNEVTSWWSIKIFDERKGKVALDFLKKGSRVLISGEPVIRKWQNRDRLDVYTPEIHLGFSGELTLVDAKDDSGGGQKRAGSDDTYRGRTPDRKAPTFDADLDDDVPF